MKVEVHVLLSLVKLYRRMKALPVVTRAIKVKLLVATVPARALPLYVFCDFSWRHRDRVSNDNVHRDIDKYRGTPVGSNIVNQHKVVTVQLVLIPGWGILFLPFQRKKLLGQVQLFQVQCIIMYLPLHSLHLFDVHQIRLLPRRPLHCFHNSNSHLVSKYHICFDQISRKRIIFSQFGN